MTESPDSTGAFYFELLPFNQCSRPTTSNEPPAKQGRPAPMPKAMSRLETIERVCDFINQRLADLLAGSPPATERRRARVLGMIKLKHKADARLAAARQLRGMSRIPLGRAERAALRAATGYLAVEIEKLVAKANQIAARAPPEGHKPPPAVEMVAVKVRVMKKERILQRSLPRLPPKTSERMPVCFCAQCHTPMAIVVRKPMVTFRCAECGLPDRVRDLSPAEFEEFWKRRSRGTASAPRS
jgi:hypothetical protein